jgi:lauroyl/myristoyl acyltransferase
VSDGLYRLMVRLSRWAGLWVVRIMAGIVAAGYFAFAPGRLGGSLRFYRALFPDCSRWRALRLAWRQYQDFAALYTERLELEQGKPIQLDSEGRRRIAEQRATGHGAILVMSHFGRWEIGARLLARQEQELTLVMGGRTDGGSRAGVDSDLRAAGLDVVTVAQGQGQAFDILQAMQTLRAGGVVSLAADRADGEARMLRLPFLGQWFDVAAAPFALALASGAPLLIVFAVRVGRRSYRFTCDEPIALVAARREDRQRVMNEAAAAYLRRLEAIARAYPEQWHTFGESLRGPVRTA